MSYYTERHGLRRPIEQTYDITHKMYACLFNVCSNYFLNIAYKYPEECPDGRGCCGLDKKKLSDALEFEIPNLYINSYRGLIDVPGLYDSFDQYALLDFIEFMYNNIKDIANRRWHQYFNHDDLDFADTREVANRFRAEINDTFNKIGVLYTLSEDGMVERGMAHGVLTKEVETQVANISEKGLRELLQDAILLSKTPSPYARQDSVEKIWDALERLKTYYVGMDKRDSASTIVNDMSGGKSDFTSLFDAEFKVLTNIGNNFRIRHHETNKIEITDHRHYDYFFNRCLSLIALAIQYLK